MVQFYSEFHTIDEIYRSNSIRYILNLSLLPFLVSFSSLLSLFPFPYFAFRLIRLRIMKNAYHRTSPYAPGGSSSLSSPSSISSNSLRSQDQSRASMNEKYRSQHPQLFNYRFVQQDRDTRPPSSSSSSPLFQQRNTVPSWYFNRNKSDEQ